VSANWCWYAPVVGWLTRSLKTHRNPATTAGELATAFGIVSKAIGFFATSGMQSVFRSEKGADRAVTRVARFAFVSVKGAVHRLPRELLAANRAPENVSRPRGGAERARRGRSLALWDRLQAGRRQLYRIARREGALRRAYALDMIDEKTARLPVLSLHRHQPDVTGQRAAQRIGFDQPCRKTALPIDIVELND